MEAVRELTNEIDITTYELRSTLPNVRSETEHALRTLRDAMLSYVKPGFYMPAKPESPAPSGAAEPMEGVELENETEDEEEKDSGDDDEEEKDSGDDDEEERDSGDDDDEEKYAAEFDSDLEETCVDQSYVYINRRKTHCILREVSPCPTLRWLME